MYGLGHKHIRIEDQQLNLKKGKMINSITIERNKVLKSLWFLNEISSFLKAISDIYTLDKNINYLDKIICSRL